MDENYATFLGYTQDELTGYFSAHINAFSKKNKVPRQRLLERLKLWYNGYSWDGEHFLYNPFSILNLFQMKSVRQLLVCLGYAHIPGKLYPKSQ